MTGFEGQLRARKIAHRGRAIQYLKAMLEEPRQDWSFEKGLAELEATVKELESGELPLEKAISVFERGVSLSDRCRKELEEAETRVEILLQRNGTMTPQPFEPAKE